MSGDVVLIGESLIDQISTVYGEKIELGGGPFNAALSICSQKERVKFISIFSYDKYGIELRNRLSECGIDLSFSVDSEAPTAVALSKTDEYGITNYSFQIDGTSMTDNIPKEKILQGLKHASCLGIGSLGIVISGFREASKFAVEVASKETMIFLDPNIRESVILEEHNEEIFRNELALLCSFTDVVKCSEEDLAWWFPKNSEHEASRKITEMGSKLVVITKGSAGASAYTDDFEVHCPCKGVVEGISIGAGDAFFGSMIEFYLPRGRKDLICESAVKECLNAANLGSTRWIHDRNQ